MRLTARQPEDDPAIDRSEAQFAARAAPPQSAITIEHPLQLGGGKVGIEHKAGAPGNFVLVRVHPRADIGAAPALPDNRPAQRPAAGAFPNHKGLTLIGDANGGDIRATCTRRTQRTPREDNGG